jgi:hypothetical protein
MPKLEVLELTDYCKTRWEPSKEAFPKLRLFVSAGLAETLPPLEFYSQLDAFCRARQPYHYEIARRQYNYRSGDEGAKSPLLALCGRYVADSRRVMDLLANRYPAMYLDMVCEKGGRSALGWACILGWLDVVKVLVQAGANVNIVFDDNRTPLSMYVLSD